MAASAAVAVAPPLPASPPLPARPRGDARLPSDSAVPVLLSSDAGVSIWAVGSVEFEVPPVTFFCVTTWDTTDMHTQTHIHTMFSPQIESRYSIKEMFGQGAYGVVWYACSPERPKHSINQHATFVHFILPHTNMQVQANTHTHTHIHIRVTSTHLHSHTHLFTYMNASACTQKLSLCCVYQINGVLYWVLLLGWTRVDVGVGV
jgi:hypothetical protein